MGGKYQRYSEVKLSGIPWVLDELPSHWHVLPAFSVLKEEQIKNTDGKETNVLSLSYGNIKTRDVESNAGLLPASFDTYQKVWPGDIVLRLTDLQNDKRSLRVGRSSLKGIITSAYLKLKASKDIDDRYLYRLLHSYDTSKVFYGMGGGLRQSLKFEDFRRLPIIVPPVDEQKNIANFLDHEIAKIDSLIANQEKLIELLKEKRQAVISHAVTKGLNPDVSMKDSGIKWLGEVPEHWKACTLRRLILEMEQGKSPECESQPADNNEWGVLKTSCVNHGSYRPNENKKLPENIEPHIKYEVKKGDLLMSRASGSPSLIGSVALVENDAPMKLLSDKIFRIKTESEVSNNYFFWLMQSDAMREQIVQSISGAEGMANNITKSAIVDFAAVLPPMKEQNEIAVKIKIETGRFSKLIEKASEQLLLLTERKSSLISAAVTGKIDVRHWHSARKEEVHV